jgi:succinate dehydrogenase/fumarate reductase flavoprotein subunit
MKAAIDTLEKIQRTAQEQMAVGSRSRTYSRDRMEAIEVKFMITTALLVARSALMRQESRGSHYRTDFPLPNDGKWLKNLVVTKNRGSGAEINAKEIA